MATSETIPESGPVHPSGGTVYVTPYVAPAHGSVGLAQCRDTLKKIMLGNTKVNGMSVNDPNKFTKSPMKGKAAVTNHSGHFLVPIKLKGINYPSWSKSMIHALTAKNKIGFINGSIEQPSEKDQPTEYALWNQCNSMILSWFTHSIEPDLAKGVIHAKTAYQVWEDFKDQFSQKNAPAIFQIQKLLASFSQDTMTVSTYFTKLKGLWDKLDTYRALSTYNQMKAHDEQREEDRLMQFLMGLHDTYNVVRTNLLMMSPLPNVRQAYSLVIQEETQRQMILEST
ncbi:hypothetical protein RJ639_018270 [Escallonia herrerae]|uniref:Retrotransposon Copia-like N-terminal domain-containing protein n=1 Tax=Escallonia herrerae TaxID=1293975 RepID=A0AA88VAX7_9ASTE|nr:hypothetical protein RJ639_018270 [Escallonia herrerae]